MIQEYLLLDNNEKVAIEQYKPEGVESVFVSVDSGKCCYVRFSCSGYNRETAKKLSEVNEYICNNYHVTVLANESSAYMNRQLYPYINHFEHCIRKLLYLKSAISPTDNGNQNINDLESKDLGQIFTLLFIDTSFETTIREKIRKQNKEFFSKDQILEMINSAVENTLWDSLLGKDTVPTLRSKYNEVRCFRNDVMHSHYISWKQYNDMVKLFRKINEELRIAIEQIDGEDTTEHNEASFNIALADALQVQQQLDEIVEKYHSNPAIRKIQEILEKNNPLAKYTIPPSYQALLDALLIIKNESLLDTNK